MASTTMPTDLGAHISAMRAITGLPNAEMGGLPDPAHKSGGGYHCGCQDIINIGKWGTAGSVSADYSVRQSRDRIGANQCSGEDVGDNWPNGGRAAWLRFNNALLAALQAADPALRALRAINFSPDGVARRRYDTHNRAQGVIPSTDSVDGHTHLEWWRDTVGTAARAEGLRKVEDLARAAITNQPIGGPVTDWESIHDPAWNEPPNGDGQPRPLKQLLWELFDGQHTQFAERAAKFPNSIYAAVRRLENQAAADATRDAATLAAIQALAAGQNAAEVLAAIQAAADETRTLVEQMQAQNQELRAQLAELPDRVLAAVRDLVSNPEIDLSDEAIEQALRRVFADAGQAA